MNSLRKLIRETLEEITKNPPVSYLFHGTSDIFLDSIISHGLKSPYLTSNYEKAGYYATDVAQNDGGEAIVLKVKIPNTDNLRVDYNELDEPVNIGDSDEEMNKKIQSAYVTYRKENPKSYDKKHKTISVDKHDYWVSLLTTQTVKYEGNIPFENISFNGGINEAHYTTWKSIEEVSITQPAESFTDQQTEIVQKLTKHFKIGKTASLGSGSSGFAYVIPNNKVLKITRDKTEAAEAYKIKGKKLKHLANVYGVYTLRGKFEGTYVIISELLSRINVDEADGILSRFFHSIYRYATSLNNLFNEYRAGDIDKKKIKELINNINETLEPADAKLAIWYMIDKFAIIDELKKYNIKSIDWGMDNLGVKKDGSLAMYDLGGYGDQDVPHDIQNVHINETEKYNSTQFSPPADEQLKRHHVVQFTGKDGNVYYISEPDNTNTFRAYVKKGGLVPIGYLHLHLDYKTNTYTPEAGKSFAVHVDPEYRRIGIGSALYDYAESQGYNILPSELQHPEAAAMWKKRKPELREFWSADEYPDFMDGQSNPTFNNRSYPPAMNLNNQPLAEDSATPEAIQKMQFPLTYHYMWGDFVMSKGDSEIMPNIGLEAIQNTDTENLVRDIAKHQPQLYSEFTNWIQAQLSGTMNEDQISSEELNKKDLPYRFSNLFDDFVTEKTEAEIREIAPTINLNRNLALIVRELEKNYPSLFDNFAEWIFEKENAKTTLSETAPKSKKISRQEAMKAIAKFKADKFIYPDDGEPSFGILDISRFNGPNADIFPGQQSVELRGVKSYMKRIQAGERPFILIGLSNFMPEYKVIDGHHRLKAYENLGIKDIPVIDRNRQMIK